MQCIHIKLLNLEKCYKHFQKNSQKISISKKNKKICLSENCFLEFKNEFKIEEHFEKKKNHSILINNTNCVIYCYQCDLEIIDFEVLLKNGKKINLFDIRKFFFLKIENKNFFENFEKKNKNLKILNFSFFENFQIPINFLESFLQIFYSNDYLRKSFKKIFLTNLFIKKNFFFDMNSKLINLLSEIIFFFDKKFQRKKIIKKFFFEILKKKPNLGKYSIFNYNKFFLELFSLIHKKLKKIDFFKNNENLKNFEKKKNEKNLIKIFSKISENFSGKIENYYNCKLCYNKYSFINDYILLKFKNFENSKKKFLKKNRENFYDFISEEICNKNSFLRNFEKFQIGIFDFLLNFFKNYEISNFGFLKKKKKIFL